MEVVAANDITDSSTLAHLLKFDSILGRLPCDVGLEGDSTIVVGRAKIKARGGAGGIAMVRPRRLTSSSVHQPVHRAAKAKVQDAGAKKVICAADEDIWELRRQV